MGVKSATARGLTSGLEPGLVLLNTTDFTTQSSVVVDNVFNATYDNYLINLKLSAVSATDIDILFYLRDN